MQTLTDVGICAVILEMVIKRLNTVRIVTGISYAAILIYNMKER